MSRLKGDKSYFTFVKGINTEAGPLTFPENTSLDEENFDLFIDGSRRKRLGIDFEESSQLITSGSEWDGIVKVFDWFSPGGDGTKQFIVLQIDNGSLFVYQVNAGGTYTLIGSVTGYSIINPPGFPSNWQFHEFQAISGNGYLFLANTALNPLILEYDSTAPAGSQINSYNVRPLVRDFDGIYDGLPVDSKPVSLTDQHKYNLINQGWNEANVTTYGTPYPSRAMIMAFGKDKSPQSTAGTYDVWTASVQDLHFSQATPAPTGHLILEAISKARQNALLVDPNRTSWTIASTWNDPITAGKSFKTVSFFAGRCWFSGSSDSLLIGQVLFSQILRGQNLTDVAEVAGACYQEADPTSEKISDLIATDGGVIKIPEAGVITKLYPLNNSILAFSENGVWEISGGDFGFTATNFRVRRITYTGIVAPDSVVVAGNELFYCGNDGIIAISPNKQTGILEATNISFKTIQTLYNSIPDNNKQYITGKYDNHLNKIVWLYYDGSSYPSTTNGIFYYMYNKILLLDLNLGAFYKYGFTHVDGSALSASNWTTTPFVVGMTHQPNYEYTVGNNYIDNSERDLKFISLSNESNTWGLRTCLLNNTSFLDWESYNSTGAPVVAYLETGYDVVGDATKQKDATYITCYFNRTEQNYIDDGSGNIVFDNPSGCLLQSRWEWADHSNSGRFSKQRQVYRFKKRYGPSGTLPESYTSGFPVVVTKNKIRGRGRSLHLRFDAEKNKDCWLAGWAINYTQEGAT